MADAPSLGDFFAKKNKKKIKASNLNVASTTNPDASKKSKAKDTEAEEWQEEEVVASTMKVEVAGKLTREEDKKEEEDTGARAWGSVKAKSESSQGLSDRKYPTLAKSVRTSTNINIDDGSQPTVNIATSKNAFAALHDGEDDDEGEVRRPKEIKPAMVQKKKGERETVAIRREVDKYGPSKEGGKREGAAEGLDDDAEQDPEEAEGRKPEVKKKGKKAEKEADIPKESEAEEVEQDEDCKIVADLEAAKAKYEGRRKPFPAQPLPKSELEAEKENRPQPVNSKKKKMALMEEEELNKPKLQYWED